MSNVYRYAAFTDNPQGGNPAGVWIGEELPSAKEMQAMAAEIGYSETVFIAPSSGTERTVRYYSPAMEVSFCGHATIASAVALAERGETGEFTYSTLVGRVPVQVTGKGGAFSASLKSVEPRTRAVEPAYLAKVLSILAWKHEDLDPDIHPILAYAGAWHLILAAKSLSVLNELRYEFEALKTLMQEEDLTTLQLVYRESESLFHARNPFPVGGVIEDPATGAAAAALGGYLREAKLVPTPTSIVIRQGEAMGRPSILHVGIPVTGGILVSGSAVKIT